MDHALPCIVCDKPLMNVFRGDVNQPSDGVAVTTHGNYGSRVWDSSRDTTLAAAAPAS